MVQDLAALSSSQRGQSGLERGPTEAHMPEQTIVSLLEERHGLRDIELLGDAGGISSANLIFRTGDQRFLLKRYRSAKLATVQRIERVTDRLHRLGFPVVPALRGSDGAAHFEWNGRWYGVFTWVAGFERHENDLTSRARHAAGALLAALHDVADPAAVTGGEPPEPLTGPVDPAALRDAIARGSSDPNLDRQAQALLDLKARLVSRLESCAGDPPYRTLVHGDYQNQNLIFSERDEIRALLDLELVDIGDPMLDVMSFIHFACCNTGYGASNLTRARNFLGGYRARRSLHPEELVRGLHASIVSLARSCFIEAEVFLSGRVDLAPFIARDARRFADLEANLEVIGAAVADSAGDE
jgi:aminoglycoside phosphotransferase (APT) family kinase protein